MKKRHILKYPVGRSRVRPDLVPSHLVFVPAHLGRLECTLKCPSRMNLGSSFCMRLDYGLGSSSSCKNPGLSSSSSRMSMYLEFGSYFDSIQVCASVYGMFNFL